MYLSHLRAAPRQRLKQRLALLLALTASLFTVLGSPAQAVTGPYVVRFSEPGDLKNHTVYRPSVPPGVSMPVLVWGEGGCVANGLIYQAFLTEIASHGILVLASGGPYQVGATTSAMMDRSIDWTKTANERFGGPYYGKLEASKIAVAGHSCGGLEAYQVAARRTEVASVGIMNSGQLQADQTQLNRQHTPILYVLGGSGDPAYSNGTRDFNRLPALLPAFWANSGAGHLGTYFNENGGQYAQILKDWVQWTITDNTTAGARFTGTPCGMCKLGGWQVRRRNIS